MRVAYGRARQGEPVTRGFPIWCSGVTSHLCGNLAFGEPRSLAYVNWWENDYEVHLMPFENSHYIVSIDHFLNPSIKVGDKVTAGQKIGTAGNSITNGPVNPITDPNYGVVELQVNYYPGEGCQDFAITEFRCPFQYFESVDAVGSLRRAPKHERRHE